MNNMNVPSQIDTDLIGQDSSFDQTGQKFSPRNVVRVVLLTLLVLLLVGVSFLLVYWLSNLLLLIIMAIFFAYLIAPLVSFVERPFRQDKRLSKWMPRPLAIGIVFLGVFGVLWIAISTLAPVINNQINDLGQQLPSYSQSLRNQGQSLYERYERIGITPKVREQIETEVTGMLTSMGEYATTAIGNIALGIVSFAPWIILIPIFGFFLLKDANLFRLGTVKMFPRGNSRGRAELFINDINKTVAAYIRAQLISCLLIGVVCTIIFYIVGVRYAFLLGLIAGILEFIPLVGPLVIGIMAATVAGFESSQKAIAVSICLLVLRLIHDYVTYPRIVREGIHLHPLAIILAVLAGGELAGITGIFLAIPT
ncbi:MAG: AI-2E family transporter, partial [Pyrinomonadaceae bacterium]|nr:AI-2E family transporter [Pyrinomonadaceae bacterium]